jgi:hypothetical protein
VALAGALGDLAGPQAFQSQRLRRDLADLAAEAQYQQIGQFFFEEMYGVRDFSMLMSRPTAPTGSSTEYLA